MNCLICGKRAYSEYCFNHKRNKTINARGKHTIEYELWRDTIAKPYLDKKYGHICSHKWCYHTIGLDVAHIKGRGSHPALKMQLDNVRWLCRQHHRLETDGKLVIDSSM